MGREERGRRWQGEEACAPMYAIRRGRRRGRGRRGRVRQRKGRERASKQESRTYHGCANEIKETKPGEREDRRRLRA